MPARSDPLDRPVLGQILTATVFGILAVRFADAGGLAPASTSLSFGIVGFVLLANLTI